MYFRSVNFDSTYIFLFGFKFFEPITILTNLSILVFCIYATLKLHRYKLKTVKLWRNFFLLIGLSSVLGSVAHALHEQLGSNVLNFFVFAMNSVSLIAVYYFYRAAFNYFHHEKISISYTYNFIVVLWVLVLLTITYFQNKFLLVKIHAGIVLLYSLMIHVITMQRGYKGSGWIVSGILVSLSSIFIHSLKLSVSDWFNYKDISHLIMLTSCILMYLGVKMIISEYSETYDCNALKV